MRALCAVRNTLTSRCALDYLAFEHACLFVNCHFFRHLRSCLCYYKTVTWMSQLSENNKKCWRAIVLGCFGAVFDIFSCIKLIVPRVFSGKITKNRLYLSVTESLKAHFSRNGTQGSHWNVIIWFAAQTDMHEGNLHIAFFKLLHCVSVRMRTWPFWRVVCYWSLSLCMWWIWWETDCEID